MITASAQCTTTGTRDLHRTCKGQEIFQTRLADFIGAWRSLSIAGLLTILLTLKSCAGLQRGAGKPLPAAQEAEP